MPPLHNAEHGDPAVILSLGAVRVTHDHGKDPEESGGPSEEENDEAEERGEDEHGYRGPDRIESARFGHHRGLIGFEISVDPLRRGAAG